MASAQPVVALTDDLDASAAGASALPNNAYCQEYREGASIVCDSDYVGSLLCQNRWPSSGCGDEPFLPTKMSDLACLIVMSALDDEIA